MSPKTTIVLAFVAGLTGGIVSQHLAGTPVYAQAPAAEAKEIRAEKFVLVDENGSPRGAFGIDPKNGWAVLECLNKKQEIWVPQLRSEHFFGHGKPAVTPPK
jgi:hypothetical protein